MRGRIWQRSSHYHHDHYRDHHQWHYIHLHRNFLPNDIVGKCLRVLEFWWHSQIVSQWLSQSVSKGRGEGLVLLDNGHGTKVKKSITQIKNLVHKIKNKREQISHDDHDDGHVDGGDDDEEVGWCWWQQWLRWQSARKRLQRLHTGGEMPPSCNHHRGTVEKEEQNGF